MNLGEHLTTARKQSGMTQEDVAAKLGVSRQTISKWELDETLPDIRQAKALARLYHLSLDDLIDFNPDLQVIKEVIAKTDEATTAKVDWTKVWGAKYPVLLKYQDEVDVPRYATALGDLIQTLQRETGYGSQDAFLVLKDILAAVWRESKSSATTK